MGYAPASVTFNSYGWRGGNAYNSLDIPLTNSMRSGPDRTATEQQYAYEWFDSSSGLSTRRNPPFAQGASGKLVPSLTEGRGVPANRILRGFIRRAEYDRADPKSTARLYFLWNPEQITRDYVSYLDQGALDPFNSVFQSGNLVPPPSFMDFTFSLMFDRQEEAQDPHHPGVFVDYEYFDLVVRNITPVTNPNSSNTGTALPDNGVMMVNPRDITVVFSPQITVQGRPSNARVNFQKFTHRMVPTRMQIDLTMRVVYFGPMKDMIEHEREEAVTASKIPWDITSPSPLKVTRAEIEKFSGLFMEKLKSNFLTPEQIAAAIKLAEGANALSPDSNARTDLAKLANQGLNANIVEYALRMSQDHHTQYAQMGGPRNKLWEHADCSSFVWGAFADYHDPLTGKQTPYNGQMGDGWTTKFEDALRNGNIPASTKEIQTLRAGSVPRLTIFSSNSGSASERHRVIDAHIPDLLKGDILGRLQGLTNDDHGHVAFIYSNNTSTKTLELVDASGVGHVGKRPLAYSYVAEHYTDAFRVLLGTPNSVDATTSTTGT